MITEGYTGLERSHNYRYFKVRTVLIFIRRVPTHITKSEEKDELYFLKQYFE